MRVWLIIFIVLIFACKPEAEKSEIRFIDPVFEDGPIKDFVNIKNVTVLDLPDSIDLGAIKQIEFYDSLVYLLEDGIYSSILVFDQKGKVERQLLRLGNGPGEYINIDFFILNDSYLAIYDRQQMKFVKYSLSHFEKFESYKTENYFVGGVSLPNNTFFLVSDTDIEEGYQLGYIFTDSDFSNIKTFPQPTGTIEGFLPQSISNFISQHHIIQAFSDNLFQITSDSLSLVTYVDFGKKSLPKEVSSFNQAYELYDVLSSGSYYFAPTNLLVRDSVISFNFFNETIDNQNFGLIQNGNAYRFSIDSDLKELFLKPITVREDLYHTVLLPGEYDEEVIDILNLTEVDYEKPILVSYTIGQ
ncbi:hypothetical protein SAMN04488104_100979 [Algoriphagus faecimaris]|uniref:6-bladed beta-propeller protein n=1 Tax=Algoriphagus faecimaris TaxID=686796 RepID=A0A1G6QK35_9BACT|nr:6-bladed beta-propeller [Algoriphagus faecimaris]SDC92037.1 hypothetical protein SAMN04488104_100979 [Algoriphagus faecimaris]